MLNVLKDYIDGDMQVTEYTRDGLTVSHIVKTPVQSDIPEQKPEVIETTLEDKINYIYYKQMGVI